MLPAIEPSLLEAVTGGRYSKTMDTDPKLIQAISQLGDALKTAMGMKAQAQQQSQSQLMQLVQQMHGDGGGGGPKSAKKA